MFAMIVELLQKVGILIHVYFGRSPCRRNPVVITRYLIFKDLLS